MSDFMIWLYLHYIKPYLDTVPAGDYNFHIDTIHNELSHHAFLLGLRTGRGLPQE